MKRKNAGPAPITDVSKPIGKITKKLKKKIKTSPTVTGSGSLTEIKKYLYDIPPYEYNLWIDVGMAIHHETDGSEAGLNLYEVWSEGEYPPGETGCREKWESFGKSKKDPVTMGTLRHLAEEHRLNIDHLKIKDDQVEFYDLVEEQSEKFPKTKKLLAPAISESEGHMVHGPEGSGKTYFLNATGLSVASGKSFIPGLTVKGARKVLAIDGEMQPARLRERKNDLMNALGLKPEDIGENFRTLSNIYRMSQGKEPIYIDNTDHQELFVRIIKEAKIDLVLFDNLLCLVETTDLNDGKQYATIKAFFGRIKALGCAVIFAHHDNKVDDYTGTRTMAADLYERIHITKIKDNGPAGPTVKVEYKKGRDGKVPTQDFNILHGEDGVKFTRVEEEMRAKPLGFKFTGYWKLILGHLKHLPQPMTLNQAAVILVDKEVYGNESAAKRAMKKCNAADGSPLKYKSKEDVLTTSESFDYDAYNIQDLFK